MEKQTSLMQYPKKEKIRDSCVHEFGQWNVYSNKWHFHAKGGSSCIKCGFCAYCEGWVGKGNYE